ncbi:FAD-binding protein [Lysinibacillus sp. 2017]|uniref:FAD-dependent monooxygenase n=1 Tax=unclassified Lysinibacillus TaxID=2636778 RepID=UPI000D528E5E|nr:MULTISPECIES: FAD-dependent monooxygenase [unclassified Lysinibacillus]AWE07544.1 FAD-binding protein [Lysinibacillus sp. 2017]TGN36707.1 FAD-binding protein [Lysinibacillus sp. S2017]
MNKKVDVCIVGGGPGGALLANLLAKKNISVLLIERTNEFAKTFRGEHLNEEGERILREHGLFERIEQLGLLRMETLEYWQNGECVKTILPDEHVGHLGIHVPQAHLLEAIIEQAKTYPMFDYMLNTSVKELIHNDQGHYTALRAVQNGEELLIESQLIIGADGRHSSVRKLANLDTTVRSHGYDLLWARIPQPAGWTPSIKMALVDNMQISLFTQSKGYVQIGWNIEKGTYPTLRKQPFTPFIEKLCVAFPQLAPSINEHIQSWKDFVLLDVFSSTSEQWEKDGVILIGDAVHTMTPTGAFGLNSALMDAHILAQHLMQEEAFDFVSCATKRKKDIAKIQAMQIEKEQKFSEAFVVFN